MSWEAIARKEFRDAIRSKMLWVISAVFGLLAVGVGGVYGHFDVFQEAETTNQIIGLVNFVSTPVSIFITLTAVIICHKAVVGERSDGSMKILLSLPHTRFDVVFGKIVGRTAVLAVPALGSLILGVALGSALLGEFALMPLVALLAAMFVLIVTYVSLMVGLSAMTGSTAVAIAGAIGYFIVFELLWGTIGSVLLVVLEESPFNPPNWYFIYNNIPPGGAFNTVLGETLRILAETDGQQAEPVFDAVYASPWFAVLVLAFWIVVPATVGYLRFSQADL